MTYYYIDLLMRSKNIRYLKLSDVSKPAVPPGFLDLCPDLALAAEAAAGSEQNVVGAVALRKKNLIVY